MKNTAVDSSIMVMSCYFQVPQCAVQVPWYWNGTWLLHSYHGTWMALQRIIWQYYHDVIIAVVYFDGNIAGLLVNLLPDYSFVLLWRTLIKITHREKHPSRTLPSGHNHSSLPPSPWQHASSFPWERKESVAEFEGPPLISLNEWELVKSSQVTREWWRHTLKPQTNWPKVKVKECFSAPQQNTNSYLTGEMNDPPLQQRHWLTAASANHNDCQNQRL